MATTTHDATINTINTSFMIGTREVTVSSIDFDRVMTENWYYWDGYLTSPKLGRLHTYIMGPRPSYIPEDWVVDHKNRNKLDASRQNLRWVSRSFNNWNANRVNASRYMGVTLFKKTGKWRAKFLQTHLGHFNTEYDAGYAYAKAVIQKWEWASDSDLLFGEGKLLVTDIKRIQEELASRDNNSPLPAKSLPKGICYREKIGFRARISNLEIGYFKTAQAAISALEAKRAEIHSEQWDAHLKSDIPRDKDGHCLIALGGQRGAGKVTLVPSHLWYILTFKKPWFLGAHGYAMTNGGVCLHAVIFEMLHPGYDKKLSIDHIIPDNKLDNRECNLRLATRSEQAFNKSKRKNCASKYVGITKIAGKYWQADIKKDKKKYYLGTFKTEEEAWAARQKKAQELYG